MLSSDLPPVEIVAADAAPHWLLTGDHGGNRVPGGVALGVGDAELARHIGWDIGVAALGRALSARLDATFVMQRYSRLVIDCNRDPAAPSAMPAVSDGTPVPGNVGLSEASRAARVAEIHAPYQDAIATLLAARPDAVLVALHSFTPVLAGTPRPWHVGVLHDGGNDAFARALLGSLRAVADLVVGDNQPYRMDTTDYSVPRHAVVTGRAYAEIEVRQDLVGDAAGVERIATLLADTLTDAARLSAA